MQFDRVGSTNDEGKRLASEGAPAGTLIVAAEQMSGRGRLGRNWSSPPGNLYSTLILRPSVSPAEAARLSFVTAVAVAEAIAPLLPSNRLVSCKWPNDVLIDGAKCAGILLESHTNPAGLVDWVVVGVGINLAHYPDEARYRATSLHDAGATITIEELLKAYTGTVLTWVNRWQKEGFASVREAWLAFAGNQGGMLRVQNESDVIVGEFVSLDESGALLLRLANGTLKKVAAGDIYPLN